MKIWKGFQGQNFKNVKIEISKHLILNYKHILTLRFKVN